MKRAAAKPKPGTRRRRPSPTTPAPERPGPGRRWISPREAAELLGVHVMTAYEWISAGRIPSARIGRKVLIDRVRLEAQLEAQAAGQTKAKGRP